MGWLHVIFRAVAKPFQWWVVVAPWEQGILVRLGKTARKLEPGPHFKIPFFDRVFVQSVRLRTIAKNNQTISTSGGICVTVSYAIQFAIVDVVVLYNSVSNPETTLRGLVEGVIAEVIFSSKGGVSPAEIQKEVNGKVGKFSDWGLSELKCLITGFAIVKTYRLLQGDWSAVGNLDSLDEHHTGEKL